MKTRKILYLLSIVLIMGVYSGVVYANDSSQGYNIEVVVKDNSKAKILQSKDGYLDITQIGQNSTSVKIATSTYDNQVLISGGTHKGTELKIEVYQDNQCINTYTTSVGITETFSQTLDLKEGNNKVYIYYENSEDTIASYVMFIIRKESKKSMEQLKTWIDVPSL